MSKRWKWKTNCTSWQRKENSAKCIVETSAFEQIEIDRVNNGQRYLSVYVIYVSLSLKTSAVGAEMGAFMASFQLDGLSRESSKWEVPNAMRLIEIDFHTRLAPLHSSIVRGRKPRQKLSSLENKTSTVLISHPPNLSLTFWDLVNCLFPMLPGPAVPGFKQLRWLHLPRSVCQHYPMSTWLKYACNQVTGVSVAAWGKWVSASSSGKTIRFVCSFGLYFSFAFHTVLFPNERNVNSCMVD